MTLVLSNKVYISLATIDIFISSYITFICSYIGHHEYRISDA